MAAVDEKILASEINALITSTNAELTRRGASANHVAISQFSYTYAPTLISISTSISTRINGQGANKVRAAPDAGGTQGPVLSNPAVTQYTSAHIVDIMDEAAILETLKSYVPRLAAQCDCDTYAVIITNSCTCNRACSCNSRCGDWLCKTSYSVYYYAYCTTNCTCNQNCSCEFN
jgi:hypothetical protein